MKTLLGCLFVALGGAVGSVSRYLLGKLPVKTVGFPVITLGINVIGAFCIGLIVAAVGKRSGGNFTALSALFLSANGILFPLFLSYIYAFLYRAAAKNKFYRPVAALGSVKSRLLKILS